MGIKSGALIRPPAVKGKSAPKRKSLFLSAVFRVHLPERFLLYFKAGAGYYEGH